MTRHRLFQLSLVIVASLVLGLAAAACGKSESSGPSSTPPSSVRVAYFPNVTHVQPLIGLSRGTFQQALGSIKIETKEFNAGPSVIEALFAGEIDIGYMGPSPAINGYLQSRGEALRVIAGAVSGGASLVVRQDSNINSPRDLQGKKIASPQLGNTQDVALRYYLSQNGMKPKEKGGNVEVIPIRNPDILSLFLRKELDGAWVPEPWATRLVREAGGRVFVDERDLWPDGKFAATVLIVRKGFLEKHPSVVDQWLKAHIDVTEWTKANPDEARTILHKEIERITSAKLNEEVIKQSFASLQVLYEPLTETITAGAAHAYDLGFLGSAKPSLDYLVDLQPLNRALREKGLPEIRD